MLINAKILLSTKSRSKTLIWKFSAWLAYEKIADKIEADIEIAIISFLCFFRIAIALIYFLKDFSLDDYVKLRGCNFVLNI